MKKYFSFEGRVQRSNYFLTGLVLSVIGFALQYLADSVNTIAGYLILIVLLLPLLDASISLGVQRLHDLNKSGWYLLIGVLPILNVIFGLYLLFKKGTDGPNQYGPDPLAPALAVPIPNQEPPVPPMPPTPPQV